MAKTTSGNGMSLTSLGGLGKHMTIMYVVVLFVLVTVLVCVYGGLNEHLAHRHLPETTVHKDLAVRRDLNVDQHFTAKVLSHMTGNYSLSNLSTRTVDNTGMAAGITANADEVVLSGWTASADSAVTLPTATKGTLFMVQQTAAVSGTSNITFTRQGSDTFDTTAAVVVGSFTDDGLAYPIGTGVITTDKAVAADTSVAYNTAGTNEFWGGIGSVISFYCYTDGVWNVRLPIAGAVGNASTGALAFA